MCDEWIQTLQTTLAILYQKSPIFSQEFLRVCLMDGTFTTMPMTEITRARDVIRYMAKKHALNNESEWGLLETWDHPGLPGGLSEKKLPNDELLLDQTILGWEQVSLDPRVGVGVGVRLWDRVRVGLSFGLRLGLGLGSGVRGLDRGRGRVRGR